MNENYIRTPERDTPARVAECIEKWLASQVNKAGAKGVVFGLSGGIDSSVVAALAVRVFQDGALGVIMPCHSDPADCADAVIVAEHIGLNYKTIDLTTAFDILTAEIDAAEQMSDMAKANLKARLRMASLYGTAQSTSRLVCGTGNRSEWETGYFTKYGDTGSDLLPLLDLFKCEVRALARYLDIPEAIIEKAPAGGLWPGQTDEGEMGFSYDELDNYLATGKGTPEVIRKIEVLRTKTQHKRIPPPACKID